MGNSIKNDTIVKVAVGESKQIFYIHRKLLCNVSPVFNAAFHPGHFLEDATETMDISDFDTNTFDYFTEWLYSGKFSGMCTGGSGGVETRKEDCSVELSNMIDLYIFADKYMLPELKSEATKSFYRHFKWHKTSWPATIGAVYRNTATNSPLRMMVADALCLHTKLDSSLMEHPSNLGSFPELLIDLVIGLCNGQRDKDKNSYFSRSEEDYLKSLASRKPRSDLEVRDSESPDVYE